MARYYFVSIFSFFSTFCTSASQQSEHTTVQCGACMKNACIAFAIKLPIATTMAVMVIGSIYDAIA